MENPTIDALILVGDRFAAFAGQRGVLTVAQFSADLKAGAYHRYPSPLRLVRGQGVDDPTWSRLLDQLSLVPPGVLDIRLDPQPVPVPREEVHKRRPENVLIGDLHRTGPGSYHADLCVDPFNDLLLDHVSGQHVQGMVLVEACRQMMLAAAIRDHSPATGTPPAFLMRSLATEFDRYLYPVPAELELNLEQVGPARRGLVELSGTVLVRQAGEVVARCTCAFSVLAAPVLARVENAAATRVSERVAAVAGRPTVPAPRREPVLTPVPAQRDLALSEV